MLKDWVELSKSELKKTGFIVTMTEDDRCTSVDLDGDEFVGTICFWKPNRFEFQFNFCETGEVAVLDTVELGSIGDISKHFQGIMKKIGIR